MNIFERLRKERHKDKNYPEKSWSVADLVEAFKKVDPNSKIDRNKINRIENGSQSPDAKTLVAYSKVFDVSVDYLLGLTNSRYLDENIAMISKTTGLSGDSVEMLKLINNKGNTLYTENVKNLFMLNHILGSFYNDPNRPNTNLYFTVLRKMWDYITLNPESIGYNSFDENGEQVFKNCIYTVNKEHIDNGDIGISRYIKLGELYKYQLEQELMKQIRQLEDIFEKERTDANETA